MMAEGRNVSSTVIVVLEVEGHTRVLTEKIALKWCSR